MEENNSISIKTECCGNCMNHGFYKPALETKVSVNNTTKYWQCNITGIPINHDSRCICDNFDSRYIPKDRGEQWVLNLYKQDEPADLPEVDK